MRQLLTESLMLSLFGALLATAVVAAFIQFIGFVADMPRPILDAMTLDARVLSVTMAVGVLSVLIFGLSPALSATSPTLSSTLNDEVGAVDARGLRRRLRSALGVTQIAVSMTLLITAALFLQSLGKALRVEPGLDLRNVLAFSYDLTLQGYPPPRAAEFNRALLERVRGTPGVQSAALAAPVPLSGGMSEHELQSESTDRQRLHAGFSRVSPEYFETIGLDLLSGRDFSASDSTRQAALGDRERDARTTALGGRQCAWKKVRFARPGEDWRTVIGVARDSRYGMLTEEPMPFVYVPWAQSPAPTPSMLARLRGEAKTILPLVVKEVRALDADLPCMTCPCSIGTSQG